MSISAYYRSNNLDFTLAKGNCLELLPNINFKFDMIFADPPYFLSNGGISVQSGKQVSVDKGDWDKSQGFEKDNDFNKQWLSLCREKLTDNGTIWVSGTFHNIFSVAQSMTELGYKILNCITWQKNNPPPNLSCRFFTHSTEFILWAKKSAKAKHYFNYELMKSINGGTQMRDVWTLPAIAKWEKSCGKHPTQKPLPLLARIILASTKENDWILDPFSGSGTTGIASTILGRRYLGLEREVNFLEMSKKRREELNDGKIKNDYYQKLSKYADAECMEIFELREPEPYYGRDLDIDN